MVEQWNKEKNFLVSAGFCEFLSMSSCRSLVEPSVFLLNLNFHSTFRQKDWIVPRKKRAKNLFIILQYCALGFHGGGKYDICTLQAPFFCTCYCQVLQILVDSRKNCEELASFLLLVLSVIFDMFLLQAISWFSCVDPLRWSEQQILHL